MSEKIYCHASCVHTFAVKQLTCVCGHVKEEGLKVPDPISQNGDIYSNDALSPKKSWFQVSAKLV